MKKEGSWIKRKTKEMAKGCIYGKVQIKKALEKLCIKSSKL